MEDAEFDDFYLRSFAPLTRQVAAMCGSLTEGQDCVQEAFIRAWQRRQSLDAEQHPEAWVRRTAYNLAVSRWRRHLRDVRPLTETGYEPPARDVDLQRALAQLPEKHRRAIVLRYMAGLPVADVARELGAPEGSVKVWLSRGRGRLADLLTIKEDTDD